MIPESKKRAALRAAPGVDNRGRGGGRGMGNAVPRDWFRAFRFYCRYRGIIEPDGRGEAHGNVKIRIRRNASARARPLLRRSLVPLPRCQRIGGGGKDRRSRP